MKIRDSIRRAGRSLGNAKARTLLTSLAIAVGAFTLTLALAGGTGARQYADKIIKSNIDPQLLMISKDKSMMEMNEGSAGNLTEYSEDSTQFRGMDFKALTRDDIDTIARTKNVVSVTPTYVVKAQYVTFEGKDKKYTADITAYDPTVLTSVAAGNIPALGRQIGDDDIVMPQSYAEKIGYKPSEMIGKKVILHVIKAAKQPTEAEVMEILQREGPQGLAKFAAVESKDVTTTVRAVSAKSATSFSASGGLFISENKARELAEYITKGTDQYQKYVTAVAKVKQGIDPASVKDDLKSKEIYSLTAKDMQSMIFTIVNLLQGIVLGFGALALFASIFGIINTQYISVLERTREIGLMKALGMRGRHVRRLFQYEAAWIGCLGGVIGALLAWVVGTIFNPWVSEKIGMGENRLLVFELLPISGLIFGLMIIAMLAGWFPARKAAKLDPIDALRTE